MMTNVKNAIVSRVWQCYHEYRWTGKWLPLVSTITSLCLTLLAILASAGVMSISGAGLGCLIGFSTLLLCGGVGGYLWVLPPRPIAQYVSYHAPNVVFELPNHTQDIEFDPLLTEAQSIHDFHHLVQRVSEEKRGGLHASTSALLAASVKVFDLFREHMLSSLNEGQNYVINTDRLLREVDEELAAHGQCLDFDERGSLWAYLHFLNTEQSYLKNHL